MMKFISSSSHLLYLVLPNNMLTINQKSIAICIKNDDYLASLEIRKIYQVLPDEKAQELNMVRIIDESEEDYLYPASYFVMVELPEIAQKLFAEVS